MLRHSYLIVPLMQDSRNHNARESILLDIQFFEFKNERKTPYIPVLFDSCGSNENCHFSVPLACTRHICIE